MAPLWSSTEDGAVWPVVVLLLLAGGKVGNFRGGWAVGLHNPANHEGGDREANDVSTCVNREFKLLCDDGRPSS